MGTPVFAPVASVIGPSSLNLDLAFPDQAEGPEMGEVRGAATTGNEAGRHQRHTPAGPELPAGAREEGGTGGRRSQARKKPTLAQRPLCTQQEWTGVLECQQKALADPPFQSLADSWKTQRLREGK
nr:hypothetical protein HJG63_009683 [Rousettus aegyptiacus]